jgi:diguanylate cyclase (GGDEF)-like protein
MHGNYEVAVKMEQLEKLLSANTRTTIASLFLAALFIYIQSDILSPAVAISWIAAMIVVNIVRFVIGRHYIQNIVNDVELVKKRIIIFRVGIILSAILWGLAGYLVDWEVHFNHLMFIVYIVAGLSAATIVVYSIDLVSAFSYLVFAITPMLISFALSDNSILITMSITGFVYVIFMGFSIKAFNQSLLDGIRLRLEAVKNTAEIQQLAFYDLLTGLPNRRLLLERLKQSLVSSKRLGKGGALLFLDLDYFKTINDTLGHNVGDVLLQQVAKRLVESVRESDTVARLGGDEFVVMIENLNTDDQPAVKEVEMITKLILTNLNQPYQLEGVDYICTPSIGVALYGEHGDSVDDLLKHADVAMYHAKKTGRNRVSIFDYEMLKELKP